MVKVVKKKKKRVFEDETPNKVLSTRERMLQRKKET